MSVSFLNHWIATTTPNELDTRVLTRTVCSNHFDPHKRAQNAFMFGIFRISVNFTVIGPDFGHLRKIALMEYNEIQLNATRKIQTDMEMNIRGTVESSRAHSGLRT